jgi:hypothetical protein
MEMTIPCHRDFAQVEPDPVEMAARYGAEPLAHASHEGPVCSKCGGVQVDMVVTGTRR